MAALLGEESGDSAPGELQNRRSKTLGKADFLADLTRPWIPAETLDWRSTGRTDLGYE
jgi:hypothetical protein